VVLRFLCLLLFVAWTAEVDTDVILYYGGMWRSPFQVLGPLFESLPVVRQPAWNLMLIALAPFCLLQRGAFRRRAWPMDASVMLALLTIVAGLAWGLARGGSGYQAYFQLRAIVTALVTALLLRTAARAPRDLAALGITVLAAALVRGTLAIYFYLAHVRGRSFADYPRWMTTHDDSALFVAGILVALSWALARMRRRTWLAAAAVTGYLLIATLLNNRRLAWVELVAALLCVYLLVPQLRTRRRVNRWLLLAAPILVVYIALGWGRSETIFAPVRAIDSMTGTDEDSSSLARNEENLNLVYTYLQHPLLGSGWGHGYLQVSSTYTHFGDDFLQYPYLPHNSFVGIVAFSGLVGLLGLWSVVPVAGFLSARSCRLSETPVEHAAAIFSFSVLPVYGLQLYGDMGLQSLTAGLLLSIAIAASGRLPAWTGAWPTRERRNSAQSRRATAAYPEDPVPDQ